MSVFGRQNMGQWDFCVQSSKIRKLRNANWSDEPGYGSASTSRPWAIHCDGLDLVRLLIQEQNSNSTCSFSTIVSKMPPTLPHASILFSVYRCQDRCCEVIEPCCWCYWCWCCWLWREQARWRWRDNIRKCSPKDVSKSSQLWKQCRRYLKRKASHSQDRWGGYTTLYHWGQLVSAGM